MKPRVSIAFRGARYPKNILNFEKGTILTYWVKAGAKLPLHKTIVEGRGRQFRSSTKNLKRSSRKVVWTSILKGDWSNAFKAKFWYEEGKNCATTIYLRRRITRNFKTATLRFFTGPTLNRDLWKRRFANLNLTYKMSEGYLSLPAEGIKDLMDTCVLRINPMDEEAFKANQSIIQSGHWKIPGG